MGKGSDVEKESEQVLKLWTSGLQGYSDLEAFLIGNLYSEFHATQHKKSTTIDINGFRTKSCNWSLVPWNGQPSKVYPNSQFEICSQALQNFD